MAHLDRSGVDQIDRTKKIHLADIDAIVAEDGIGHRDVEKGVGDRHLQQVVLAADDLAGCPGEFDLALARARVLRLLHALREKRWSSGCGRAVRRSSARCPRAWVASALRARQPRL